MKIEILGTGCPKCKKLEELARKAVQETGADAEVVKVEEMDKILSYGIMMTPALVLDGDVKCSGKIADIDEIKKWISE
jgi:small redox-active disulfide protein 2